MGSTEAILDSDSPVPGIRPRCFAGKPRSSSGRRLFRPPTGGNVPFPCPKITDGCRVTAGDRQKHWLEAGWRLGRAPVTFREDLLSGEG